ncbi:MAG: hypothetical protein WC707_01915 [Candidatus Babeliaceae bacterium]|jgi:hypothetical protein
MMKKNKYLQFCLTIFTLILIPAYWHYYGPQNFLWLSDVGLFLTVIALWLHSQLVISIAAVGILALELIWCLDYVAQLIFNINLFSLADYMFNPAYPLIIRGLSLFHIVTPVIWIIYLKHYGYDKRAPLYFTFLYWIIAPVTYFYTNPADNINWMFFPQAHNLHMITPLAWLGFLMIFVPFCIVLPTHILLNRMYNKKKTLSQFRSP